MDLPGLRLALLLLFFPLVLLAKNPSLPVDRPSKIGDSLRAMLLNAKHDTDRCRLNIQIGNTWVQTSPDSAIAWYRRTLLLAQSNLDNRENGPAFRKYYSSSLRSMGNAHFYKGNYDAAIGFYQQSLRILVQLNDKKGMLMCYNNLGLVAWKQGAYDEALAYYLKSLSICEKLTDKNCLAAIRNNMGLIYWEMGNNDQAAACYRQSLSTARELGNKSQMSDALNNLGLVTWEKKDYDSAVRCYEVSLAIKKELADPKGISSCYTNIGLVYNDKGDPEKAIGFYHKALDALRELDDKNEIALINGNLASAWLSLAKRGNPSGSVLSSRLQNAVLFGDRSYRLALAIGALPLQNSSAAILMEAWKALGDFRKATDYAEKYIATRDSMFSEEKTKALAEMDARYKVEKKQIEIDRLVKEKELQSQLIAIKEKENRDQRILLLITISGVVLITIFSIIIASLYANKRKVNALLEIQKAEIEEKNLTKDKLFSIISHDLRNPFNTILGFCDLLVRETGKVPVNPELQRIAAILQGASHQANNLLTSLLEWSLLQTHRLTPNPETVSVKELADDMVALFRDYAGEKDLLFRSLVPEGHFCFSDKEMTRTVLRNLVSNAIKFTREGGSVTITSEAGHADITVSVIDTGIGLTPDQADELFKLKKNIASKGTADEKGTGLGLIISKEFVEANKGSFSIESQPGKGTRTSFSLPGIFGPDNLVKQVPGEIPGNVLTKILVAEDDEANNFLLSTILEKEKYQVVAVSNGIDAVDAIREQPDIRLALIDLGMPGKDGFQVLREIRERGSGIPVIAHTGRNFPEELAHIRTAGFSGILLKPVEKEMLLRMISEKLASGQS